MRAEIKMAATDANSPDSSDPILIRKIALADVEAAAELCAELGYPAELELIRERIALASSSNGRVVYVACLSHSVVGWIDVAIVHHLSTGTSGEIAGLIVSSTCRGRRIGQKLVAQAERWVAEQGIPNMIVRSRIAREAAHRFYLREGYLRTKTSAVFTKQL